MSNERTLAPLASGEATAPAWLTHRITQHLRWLVAATCVLPVVPLLRRQPTVWYDEGYTFFYSHIPVGTFPRALWDLDLYTAGFYVVERAGVAVFGDGRLGLRTVPALFAMASVAMFAAVLRRRGVRPTPTLVVTALFAVSPPMAAHAGNARGYSMVTFWYLWCLYVVLSDQPLTRKRSIVIGLLLGGGIYVHASLLVGLPLLALLLVRRYGVRSALRPLVLGAALTMPLGLQLATHTVNGVGSGLSAKDLTIRRLASIAWHFTWQPVLLVVLGAALAVSVVTAIRNRSVEWDHPTGSWVELAGMVLPIAAAVVATPAVSLWSWSYLWIAGVGVFLAAAHGIDLAGDWFRRRVRLPRAGRLVIAALVIGSVLASNLVRNFSNDDLQGAYAQLVTRAQPGDVVVAPLLADALAMRYQAGEGAKQPAAELLYVFDDWLEPMRQRQINEISEREITEITDLAAGRRVWLVHWDASLPVSARFSSTNHLSQELLPGYCFKTAWTGRNVIILEGHLDASCPMEGTTGSGTGG